jgi:adenylate cyclase
VNRVRRHSVAVVLVVALSSSGLFTLPRFDHLRNLSIDALTWLRWTIFGRMHEPSGSPAVVVVIDEETFNRKPFVGTPTVTWTRELGSLVTGLINGGAKVVGFDIIFPNLIEQSVIPVDQETLGAKLRGFDRDYLRALAGAARDGKLVLGQVLGQDRPIAPSDAQRVAVGHERNIRPLNVYTDADGVVRRVPLTMDVDGLPTPSMSLELAARALRTTVQPTPKGEVKLDEYSIPQNVSNTLTLNFEGGSNDIPTYSVADLHECLKKGDAAYFRRHFAGRVVLLGVLLDLEDRSLTSKRFATGVEGALSERCGTQQVTTQRGHVRDSIASVYIHATAVNNLLRQEGLQEFSRPLEWTSGFCIAALSSTIALAWTPATAALLLLGLLLACTAIGTWAMIHTVVLPLVYVAAAGILAFFATIAFRFVVTDKDKRLLRRNFSFYLAPILIERMMSSDSIPSLGGEIRVVTLYRSDLAGFSALSEKLAAHELVSLMNEYLSAMTEIIDSHGGYVDKYIGDAIDGVFGAPMDDPNHAVNAVRAALACQVSMRQLNDAGLVTFKGYKLRQRIGLHTGSVLVGNIGSRQRFNYTAMGDAANLASRLESANKVYGTSIMASESTVRLAECEFAWRELDSIQVVGRRQPVAIFEPLAELGKATAVQKAHAAAYAQGLKCWRSRDFAGAVEAFGRYLQDDPPALLFRERAKNLLNSPPDTNWSPINALDSK